MYGNDKENGMRFFKSLVISLLFVPILVSCPLQFTSDDFLGKRIINYPSWINELNAEFKTSPAEQILAYSPWMNWQEEGKELQRFVKKVGKIDAVNFNGKFRLIMRCQELFVAFNDSDLSYARFFCYIGDFKAYNIDQYEKEKYIYTPINNENIFEYDCYFREYSLSRCAFVDNVSDSNKAHVKFEKVDDNIKYILTVAEKEIVNTTLLALKTRYQKIDLGKELSWMPYSFKEINPDFKNMNQYYGVSMMDFYKNRENPQEFEFRYSLKTLYCLEGITLRSIDESRRAISFYLEDRKESNFADYLELVIGDERPYKDNSNQEWSFGHLSNGMLTFYKEQEDGNDLVVRQFDKNQVQFAFDEFQPYIKM